MGFKNMSGVFLQASPISIGIQLGLDVLGMPKFQTCGARRGPAEPLAATLA